MNETVTTGSVTRFYSKEAVDSATFPTLTLSVVPEPGTVGALLCGAGVLLGLRRRR